MRIITGKFKGRLLATVSDKSVRPAMDRVKTTIFNMLQNRLHLEDARVLDLFAGSGSLGFEALSRGASRVLFVDDNPDALEMIEENAERLGCLEECEIIDADALTYLRGSKAQFDLIFADPPYAVGEVVAIPELVFNRQLLSTSGFLIIEHSKRTTFEPLAEVREVVRKEFGNTHVTFFDHPPSAS